ncbi:MAG: hypothetical protein M0C28_17600 [Candidatus Moduliflexus flocculans]|nr:hypothetical protein [Candidatus Moduliflexus flocculans]
MNRITVSQGSLNSATGKIDITTTRGTRLQYDGGSNRRKAEYYDTNGTPVTEFYGYDPAGRFTDTYRLDAQNNPLYTSRRFYDAAGRVAEFRTYSAPGVLSGRTVSTYNKNGWLLTQASYNGSGGWLSTINRSMAGAYGYDGRALQYQAQTPATPTLTPASTGRSRVIARITSPADRPTSSRDRRTSSTT